MLGRIALIILLLLLASLALLGKPSWAQTAPACDLSGSGTALANAAANLGEKETCTFAENLNSGGVSPFMSTQTEREQVGGIAAGGANNCESVSNSMTSYGGPMAWMPGATSGNGRAWIAGGEHPGYGTGVFYLEASNTWVNPRDGSTYPPQAFGSRLCGTSSPVTRAALWAAYGHTYNHNAYDPTRRQMLHKGYANNSTFLWGVGNDTHTNFWDASVNSHFPTNCGYWGTDDVAASLFYFPERDSYILYGGTGRIICEMPGGGGAWSIEHTDLGGTGINAGNYHTIGAYVAAHDGAPAYIVVGGGNGETRFWQYNADNTVSAAFTAPDTWNIPYDFNPTATVVTASPNGKAVFMPADGTVREYDPATGLSGDVATATTPNNYPGTFEHNTWYAHTQPIYVPEYGVTLLVAGNGGTIGSAKVALYKHANTNSPTAQDQDFAARCSDPDTLLCFGFESQAERDDHVHLDGSEGAVSISTAQSASGSSALLFTQPAGPGSGSSDGGSWETNLNGCGHFATTQERDACATANGGVVEIGAGQRIAYQFAYMQGPNSNTVIPLDSGGQAGSVKLGMLGYADQSGALESGSCSNNELVLQATQSRGYVESYHACGYYIPFDRSCAGEPGCIGGSDIIKTQDEIYVPGHASGNERCLYHGGGRGPAPGTFPMDVPAYGPCVPAPVQGDRGFDTYQIVLDVGADVEPGSFGGANFASAFCGSRYRMYIQDAWGQASTLVADWPDMCLRRDTVEGGWGKLWLLPYQTSKSTSQTHPEMLYYYDDVVISQDCINDPGTNAPPPGCARINTMPPVSKNGFLHESQIPVLMEEEGDILVAGWGGPDPITIPAKIAQIRQECAAGGASREVSGDWVIMTDQGITELEKSTLLYDDYYICPGNYLNSAGGLISINASGSARTDAGLVKVMCVAPTAAGQRLNPWQRNPSPEGPHAWSTTRDYTVECVLPPMIITNQDYWLFHSTTHWKQGLGATKNVHLEDSSGHVFDRIWSDCSRFESNLQGEGGICFFIYGQSDNNIVQGGAFGPQAPQYNHEGLLINVYHSADNNWIANNRFWNAGKGVQNGGNWAQGTGEGTHVINNDFFDTPGTRLSALGQTSNGWYSLGVKCRDAGGSECGINEATSLSERRYDPAGAHAALFDPDGLAGCSQVLVSFKNGSNNPANPAILAHNRFYGKRPGTTRCSGDGTLKSSAAFANSINPENTLAYNNVMFDNGEAFGIWHTSQINANYDNLVYRGNVIEFADIDWSVHSQDATAFRMDTTCRSPCVSPIPKGITIEFNTIAEIPNQPQFATADPFHRSRSWSYLDTSCNLLYGAKQTASSSTTGAQNVVVDGTLAPSLSDTVTIASTDVAFGDFTFWYDLAGEPKQHTIPNIIPPAGVSFEDHCTQTAPTEDIQGVARTAGATTPGAFVAGSTVTPTTPPVIPPDPPVIPPGNPSGPPQPPTRVHFRVNAGGGTYQDDNGNIWEACNAATPQPCAYITQSSNSKLTNNDPIANTAEDSLFQTVVYDLDAASDMVWDFPAPNNGKYEINLYGAENNDNYTAPGGRAFDVLIEGVLVYDNLDHVAEAGGTNAAYMRSYTATVFDGSVTITFRNEGIDVPTISAIEVIELPPEKKPFPNEQGATPLSVRPLVDSLSECRTGWDCLVRPAPDVTLQSAGADWADLTQVANDVFHLQPGDYRARGVLSLTSDGASDASRKWVRCLGGTARALKIDVAHCKLWAIEVDASNWVVEGVTLDQDGAAAKLAGLGDCSASGVGGSRVPPVTIGGASAAVGNILDGALIEDYCHGNAVAQSDKGMIEFAGANSTGNYIQGSLLRDAPPIPNQRTAGVRVACSAIDNKISSNELYDLTVPIHINCPNTAGEVRGTIVENNDIHQTDAYRANCSGSLSATGDCDASLAPVRINGSGTGVSPVQVVGNRIWGDRRTDVLVADWEAEDSTGVRVHADAPGLIGGSYAWIAGNTIDQVAAAFTCPVPGPSHVSLIGNVAHVITDARSVGANAFIGDNFCVNGEMYHNRFAGDPPYSLAWTAAAADTDVRCNVFVHSGSGTLAALSYSPSGVWDLNRFVDVAEATFGGTDTNEVGVAAAQGVVDIRYWRRHLTSIESAIIPKVRLSSSTPNLALCSAFGQVLDRGVNDLYAHPKP